MPVENFVILRGQHGRYGEGSVLPRFVFEEAAGANAEARAAVVAEMVARGQIAPTGLPVNRDIAPPVKLGAAADPDAGLKAEFDRLRSERDDLLADRDAHANRAAKAQASQEAMQREVAKYVAENSELRAAVTEREGRIAELERETATLRADLEAATAPTPKKGKQPAGV